MYLEREKEKVVVHKTIYKTEKYTSDLENVAWVYQAYLNIVFFVHPVLHFLFSIYLEKYILDACILIIIIIVIQIIFLRCSD